jgi:hypothetical protein
MTDVETLPAFTFATSGDAYTGCQCLDDLAKDGATLVCADGVIGLSYAWPVAVTVNAGALHALIGGDSPEDFRHEFGAERGAPVFAFEQIVQAVAFALALRLPIRPEFEPYKVHALHPDLRLPEAVDPWASTSALDFDFDA